MITSLTEYVGFWRRIMALLVDLLWIAPLLGVLLYISAAGDYANLQHTFDTFSNSVGLQIFLVTQALPALLILTLFTLWFWIAYGATPGKLLFDCQIVNARTGERIKFTQALLRFFGYIISLLPLGLGFLWIIVDKRKRGWHDKIAGTAVIIHDEATVSLAQLVKSYH